jgi:hypothetical protein
MIKYVWGYFPLQWCLKNKKQWLMKSTISFSSLYKFPIFFTLEVHLSLFHYFQCAFITFFDASMFYFQKHSFKVFNNYLMSNLTQGYGISFTKSQCRSKLVEGGSKMNPIHELCTWWLWGVSLFLWLLCIDEYCLLFHFLLCSYNCFYFVVVLRSSLFNHIFYYAWFLQALDKTCMI